MSSITVRPISSRQESEQFVRFPWRIYDGNPYWVPPLLVDRRKLISKEKNPFYAHADAEFFLAHRNGQIVGRIGAIVNHLHNEIHNERTGFFGFFESIDDPAVASALFDAAEAWLSVRGMTAMRGPVSPSINDEVGLLVDGFDRPPVVLMPYNPSYYAALLESRGLHKVKDLHSYSVSHETVFTDKLKRVSDMVRKREGLTFRSLNMKDFANEVRRIKMLYNRAWQKNWGAVPMTDAEFDAMAKDLRPVVNPDLVILAEYKGEPIGFSLSLPDLNIAFKHNKRGFFLPGLFALYRYRKKINLVRIIVLGVLPEYLKSGAGAVLFYETALRGVSHGYIYGEAGWVLEDNVMMVRAAEFLNGRRIKTYRIYEKPLTH
jgi:GNAT superfamily N-acetyltransferase